MDNTLPEPVQFYLNTCERISDLGIQQGDKSLSIIERIVFRAYIFGCEVDNGGLTGFLYNIAVSSDVAGDTAQALEAIGASSTAALLRSATAVVCCSESIDNYRTWGDYLDAVDPTGHLEYCSDEIYRTDEEVLSLLEYSSSSR